VTVTQVPVKTSQLFTTQGFSEGGQLIAFVSQPL
jgi:hypothetical protein